MVCVCLFVFSGLESNLDYTWHLFDIPGILGIIYLKAIEKLELHKNLHSQENNEKTAIVMGQGSIHHLTNLHTFLF